MKRETVRDAVIAHIDELDDRELVALGRWLAAIERGRARQGIVADESDQDLADAVAYLELQVDARKAPRIEPDADIPWPVEGEL